MQRIYIFSGLGADKNVFSKINFGNYIVTHLEWYVPNTNETLHSYASYYTKKIETTNATIIGLSFGGIIAQEIAKQLNISNLILVSSIKLSIEKPWYFIAIKKLQLHKIMPVYLFTKSNFITHWFFGIHAKEEKNLLKQILQNTDKIFLKWAINQFLFWENETYPNTLIHIHGKKDRILPKRNIQNAITISGGGHFMIWNKSEEVNLILNTIFSEIHL